VDPAADLDRDGLRDDCEYELAQAFRPLLAMSAADRAPSNEPYWSVTRQSTSFGPNVPPIKIIYALSYYRDPGDPLSSFHAHDGDSEFIIIEVHQTTDPDLAGWSRWALDFVTFSAHWGEGAGVNHTSRYEYNSIEFPADYRGRPRVWVSLDKHANYRSKSLCASMWNDWCTHPAYPSGTIYRDVIVDPNANLGNY
jgi:hypothetical protein